MMKSVCSKIMVGIALFLAAVGQSSCTNVYQYVMDMGAVYPGVQVDTESFYNYKGEKYVKGCRVDYRRVFTESPITFKENSDRFKVVNGTQGSPIFREILEEKDGIYYAPSSKWESLPIDAAPAGSLESSPLPEERVGERCLTVNALWSYPAGVVSLVCVDLPIHAVMVACVPVAIVCAPVANLVHQQRVRTQNNRDFSKCQLVYIYDHECKGDKRYRKLIKRLSSQRRLSLKERHYVYHEDGYYYVFHRYPVTDVRRSASYAVILEAEADRIMNGNK